MGVTARTKEDEKQVIEIAVGVFKIAFFPMLLVAFILVWVAILFPVQHQKQQRRR